MISLDVLEAVTIPVACPVPWHAMHGNDRTRFCDQCRQNVHDVSALTRAEALELLSASETPCLRIYRRADGRVMTADCEATRRERVWRWLDKRSTWAAWLFALVFFAGCDSKTECVQGGLGPPPRPTKQAVQSVLGGPAAVAAEKDELAR